MADVGVIGAGLAGLVAAAALRRRGAQVTLIEAGERPGGRLASRRLGAATLDDGAQFFTVRDDGFAGLVDGWRASGCPITVWSHGFAQAPSVEAAPDEAVNGSDGHPRYVVHGGMQRLAEHVARDQKVRTACTAVAVEASTDGFRVRLGSGELLSARALLLTPPLPRTFALLDAGGLTAQADLEQVAELRAVGYAPCLSLLAALERSPELPAPGGVQFDGGPVRFLADNATKRVSPVPAVTVHGAEAFSRAYSSSADATVIAQLTRLVRPWLGGARIAHAELTRWRHAQPSPPREQRAAVLREAVGAAGALVLAGDAFAGAKVEGAALSGLAAAKLLAN